MRSFLLRFFYRQNIIFLNFTKVERRKLESSVRIAEWVKSKMSATMARVVVS